MATHVAVDKQKWKNKFILYFNRTTNINEFFHSPKRGAKRPLYMINFFIYANLEKLKGKIGTDSINYFVNKYHL